MIFANQKLLSLSALAFAASMGSAQGLVPDLTHRWNFPVELPAYSFGKSLPTLDGETIQVVSTTDIGILRLSKTGQSLGSLVWDQPGGGQEIVRAVQIDAQGMIYVVYESVQGAHPGGIVKFSPTLEYQWRVPAVVNEGTKVALDTTGLYLSYPYESGMKVRKVGPAGATLYNAALPDVAPTIHKIDASGSRLLLAMKSGGAAIRVLNKTTGASLAFYSRPTGEFNDVINHATGAIYAVGRHLNTGDNTVRAVISPQGQMTAFTGTGLTEMAVRLRTAADQAYVLRHQGGRSYLERRNILTDALLGTYETGPNQKILDIALSRDGSRIGTVQRTAPGLNRLSILDANGVEVEGDYGSYSAVNFGAYPKSFVASEGRALHHRGGPNSWTYSAFGNAGYVALLPLTSHVDAEGNRFIVSRREFGRTAWYALTKYSPDGPVQWTRELFPYYEQEMYNFRIASAGGAVVVAADLGANDYTIVQKFIGAGATSYVRPVDPSFNVDNHGLAMASEGTVYVGGLEANSQMNGGKLVKLTLNGSLEWTSTAPELGKVQAITVTPNGDAAVVSVAPYFNTVVMRLTLFSAAGEIKWTRILAETEHGRPPLSADMRLDRQGNLLVATRYGYPSSHHLFKIWRINPVTQANPIKTPIGVNQNRQAFFAEAPNGDIAVFAGSPFDAGAKARLTVINGGPGTVKWFKDYVIDNYKVESVGVDSLGNVYPFYKDGPAGALGFGLRKVSPTGDLLDTKSLTGDSPVFGVTPTDRIWSVHGQYAFKQGRVLALTQFKQAP